MQRPLRLLASSAVAALALAGCVPGAEPAPTPSPTATATAVFASEEEAYSEAQRVYAGYRAAALEITHSGDGNFERTRPFVTDDFFEFELTSYQRYLENGWRSVGTIETTYSPQSASVLTGDVTLYVCEDMTDIDVVDSSGTSVVSDDRPDLIAIEVNFRWSDSLRISGMSSWPDTTIC